MPYTPKTWNLSDPITDTDLNRIETGIDEAMEAVDTYLTEGGIPSDFVSQTGATTSGFVIGSGWNLTSEAVIRYGNVISVRITVTRTGGTVTASATGAISTTSPGFFTSAYRPSSYQYLHATANGVMAQAAIGSDGAVTLSRCSLPNHTITNGQTVEINGTFVAV